MFRELVNKRGDELRKLEFAKLTQLVRHSAEQITIGNRKATIALIVQPQLSGGILVVVQGFMAGKFLRFVKDVALDGFYKYSDETMAPMSDEDMRLYD